MSEHPGMVPREEWEQTDVHKASTYSCGKCGESFETPHDFYDHLDEVHPKEVKRRGSRRRSARRDDNA